MPGELEHVAAAGDDQLAQFVALLAEDDVAPGGCGGGVQVDDDWVGDATNGFDRALDQVAASGGEDDDRDVLGCDVRLGDQAHEVVVGLRGGWVADLDLLVAHLHHELEEASLALGVHRFGERLIAVSQVR